MADGSHPTRSFLATGLNGYAPPSAPTSGPELAASLRAFATEHGGASAAIEYAGRRGARIVLAGSDGAGSDHFADSTEVARAACQRAGIGIETPWEQELEESMRPSNDLWRSMNRRVLSR